MILTEIKDLFENKSIEKRIDFIDNYNFVEDLKNRKYFIEFLTTNDLCGNHWYDSQLIELAIDLNVKDNILLKKYLDYLVNSNNYLIKLSVLDYIVEIGFIDNSIEKIHESLDNVLNSKYDRLIVKNQALLTLLMLDNKDMYKIQLITNLKKSKDYRSHIRLYNFIGNYMMEKLHPSYIMKLIEVSNSKDLGRAVEHAIDKVTKRLK